MLLWSQEIEENQLKVMLEAILSVARVRLRQDGGRGRSEGGSERGKQGQRNIGARLGTSEMLVQRQVAPWC